MKKYIKKIFNVVGLEVINREAYLKNITNLKKRHEELLDELSSLDSVFRRLESAVSGIQFAVLGDVEFDFFKFSSAKLRESRSQLFQDLFVLYFFEEKGNGYFVEFGATDGVSLSNSFLLEKGYQWKGIVCEPGKLWHEKLVRNRTCLIDLRCVWSESGLELVFNQTANPELSTIEVFNDSDGHAAKRKEGVSYTVKTISLLDLLAHHNAPREIDYLSIDTEGSEYEILNAFDFDKYEIRIITVEHNCTARRNDIYRLLINNGYRRVFENISQWDDWYVKETLLNNKAEKRQNLAAKPIKS